MIKHLDVHAELPQAYSAVYMMHLGIYQPETSGLCMGLSLADEPSFNNFGVLRQVYDTSTEPPRNMCARLLVLVQGGDKEYPAWKRAAQV